MYVYTTKTTLETTSANLRKTVQQQLGENLAKLLGDKWATTCRKLDNSKEKTGKNSAWQAPLGENWATTQRKLSSSMEKDWQQFGEKICLSI